MLWFHPCVNYAVNLFLNSHYRFSLCMMYYLTLRLQSYFSNHYLLLSIERALHAKLNFPFLAV